MDLNKDFEEFFELLNKHNVRYVVVGGYAVIFHGYPRLTGDIDVFYQAEKKNIEALLQALKDFGFNFSELSAEELEAKGQVVQLGQPPNRIDLINSITGGEFEKIWSRKVSGNYGKEPISYIHLEDLVKNKQAVGRNKDKQDLEFFKKK